MQITFPGKNSLKFILVHYIAKRVKHSKRLAICKVNVQELESLLAFHSYDTKLLCHVRMDFQISYFWKYGNPGILKSCLFVGRHVQRYLDRHV